MRRLFLLLAVLCLVALSLPAEESYLHHRLDAHIVVADPERAAERIAGWAESEGGHFLLRSSQQAVIRLPNASLPGLRVLLESEAEEIISVTPRAVDLREDLLGVRSGIRSREEILQRNLSFLDRADVEGTLAIEREVMALLQEIEGLKGRLRRLEADRRMALARIDLTFLEQTLPEDIPSSFGWINGVSFYGFVGGGF